MLEVCLAVAIGLMLVLIAIPSVRSVFREQRIQRTAESFDDLVRKAQARSVNERRTYALIWQKDGIDLTPMERTDDQPAGDPERFPFDKEHAYALERTGAMIKDPPAIWTFWRSGACEPATVTYKGPEGSWTATYNPLTTRRSSFTETLQ